MKTVDNWNSLTSELKKHIADTLAHEVQSIVKETYLGHIQTDVYGAYRPTVYARREHKSGLLDENNLVGEVVGGTLEVRNVTKPNKSISQPQTTYTPSFDTQFAAWIERGEAYNGKAKYLFPRDMSEEPWANSRPFTESAIQDLQKNKQHMEALKNGLIRHGLKV